MAMGHSIFFYERNDVFTVSIHADPVWKFPHFLDSQTKPGEVLVRDTTLISSRADVSDTQYDSVLQQALEHIIKFKPSYIVVPYGADTIFLILLVGSDCQLNISLRWAKGSNLCRSPP
jgi:acetoin utilization deacetylase AcuC-like enzyme